VKGNKTVVIFLLKFFGTYLVLFLIYAVYLNRTQKVTGVFSCAPITKTVAGQTQYLLNCFGYNTVIEQHTEEVSIKLIVNNKFVATIIEGCNSISIVILFISFIVAFASNFKTTALYILFGSLIIYFSNIVRIALITIALFEYPKYRDILHDFIFPSIIYGITFLLWFIWVQKFSRLKK
jgi:exosortase family protein XrtF